MTIKHQESYAKGYDAAVRDICSGLRTKRTAGGETIQGAVHAADVIERGDFVGFASKAAPPTPAEGDKP
jgi:hypothetical protein